MLAHDKLLWNSTVLSCTLAIFDWASAPVDLKRTVALGSTERFLALFVCISQASSTRPVVMELVIGGNGRHIDKIFLFGGLIVQGLKKSHAVQGFHHQLRRLLLVVFVEGDLLYDIWMICKIQPSHDLILNACLLKYVLDATTHLFYGKELPVAYARTFLDCSISSL